MSAIQTTYVDNVVGSERYFVFQKVRYFAEAAKPPLVFCHQHATPADGQWSATYYQRMFRALAEDFTIIAGDMGFVPGQDTWGNSTLVSRIGTARSYLGSAFGSTGNVTLAAASMGSAGVLNYAKANPTEVAAVAVCVPLLSLWSLRNEVGDTDGGGPDLATYQGEVDGAYGGAYTDGTYGATYSPHHYRASYPDDTVPTALWTSNADAVCLPSYANDFVNDNPLVSHRTLGAVAHDETAIDNAVDSMVHWLRGARGLVRQQVLSD